MGLIAGGGAGGGGGGGSGTGIAVYRTVASLPEITAEQRQFLVERLDAGEIYLVYNSTDNRYYRYVSDTANPGSYTFQNFTPIVRGPSGASGSDGSDGSDGSNGWIAVLQTVVDGERRVQQISDWVGGTGTKPATGDYIGATGQVTDISQATDIRGGVGPQGNAGAAGAAGSAGPKGDTGDTGPRGNPGAAGSDGSDGANGWTAVLSNVIDGERVVQQVTGWTGGTGTPPSTGMYITSTGLTASIAEATDIRGSAGTDGQGVPAGGSTGQRLTKSSNIDFATRWETPTTDSGGGTTPPVETHTFRYGLGDASGVFASDPAPLTASDQVIPLAITMPAAVGDNQRWIIEAPVGFGNITITNTGVGRQDITSQFTQNGRLWVFNSAIPSGVGGHLEIGRA